MIEFHKHFNFPKTKEYVLDVIENQSFNDFGKYYHKCSEFLIELTGAKKIILTHSATAALELATQMILNVNSKALIPSFTFSSTANSVLKNNSHIEWGEIELESLCLDLENEDNKNNILSSELVIPVHYGAGAVKMDNLLALSNLHNTEIIEDAAQSLGVFIGEKHVGTFGKFGAISFHNTKFIHAGFGGALLINDLDYFDEAMEIYNRGTNRHLFQEGKVNKYNWTNMGSSFGNSEINFAVLFSQLENLDFIVHEREKIYKSYQNMYDSISKYNVKIQDISYVSKSNYSSFYLLLENLEQRNNLINFLKNNDISSQFHYIPLHNSPMGKKISSPKNMKKTEFASDGIIRLPIYPSLKLSEQEYIKEKIIEFFEFSYQ